nr:hypothetical protein [Burkholderia pseudomallei]
MPIKKIHDRLNLLQRAYHRNRPLRTLGVDAITNALLIPVAERSDSHLEVDLPGVASPNRPCENFICHFSRMSK